jgi:hypothetical protein
LLIISRQLHRAAPENENATEVTSVETSTLKMKEKETFKFTIANSKKLSFDLPLLTLQDSRSQPGAVTLTPQILKAWRRDWGEGDAFNGQCFPSLARSERVRHAGPGRLDYDWHCKVASLPYLLVVRGVPLVP